VKILLVSTRYAPNVVGGAERVVQSLAEAMVGAGHQVTVVSTAPQQGTRTDWVSGVKVYYVGLRNVYWPSWDKENPKVLKPLWHALDTYNIWMAREVARILETEEPDIMHTNTLGGFSTIIWQVAKQRSVPLVHTIHDYYLLCPRGIMFRNGENCKTLCPECRLYGLLRRRFSNQVDVVVGVSRFSLERHLEFGYFATTPNKRVIFNSYEVGATAPSLDTQYTRFLPVRFGYLGRLLPLKGLEELLESVRRLPEGSWSLDVAGRGYATYERYLQTKCTTSAIRFLGLVEPKAFFRQIDVLVVPSVWHDPLPTVIIEACAHGVPVIGSSRGGIPELIEEQNTGFLFDPDRPGDLRAKMQRYIDEPAMVDIMRSACLKKAEGFLTENILKQYLNVYDAAR
jgi:glycosyltransferase involved in cell wall biosynthesis